MNNFRRLRKLFAVYAELVVNNVLNVLGQDSDGQDVVQLVFSSKNGKGAIFYANSIDKVEKLLNENGKKLKKIVTPKEEVWHDPYTGEVIKRVPFDEIS